MGGFIYTLFDVAEPDHVRYVGQTQRIDRLKAHIKEAKYGRRGSHKRHWIMKVLASGSTVSWRHIDTGSSVGDLNDKERYWIEHFKSRGHRLTNSTDGGDGIPNPSPEVRAKIAAAAKGRTASPETRAKMSAAQLRRPLRPPMSDAQKAKLSAARTGKKLSPEHRAKVRAHLIGRPVSAETRLKMSLAQKGKLKRRPQMSSEQKLRASMAISEGLKRHYAQLAKPVGMQSLYGD